VVRVTGNFTSENPLSPAVKEALLAAFDQGWADPKKISQSSAKAAILKNQSLEILGSKLGIRPDQIEVLGEPALGHYFSIFGLLTSTKKFAYAAIDKGKIRALARAHSGPVQELKVDSDGHINEPLSLSNDTVLSWQLANGETGVIQKALLEDSCEIAVDATTSAPRIPLPLNWATAAFDAQSWGGPAGLGLLAVNSSSYTYPLPRIAPIKSPGSYSLPLLIASAVALETFTPEETSIRNYLINSLSGIEGLLVVAPKADAIANKVSLVVQNASGEQIVRALAEQGIDIDSGSACSPADLQPSHVLAEMGYPTSGHLRITLHQGTTRDEIDSLKAAITQLIR
jgi:cysteine desulfurase